ncbi:hypothetical protein AGMMS49975_14060 [Clostridia bacterium]|nr:hypothetical protein AGMMS49975_14060 [Clostridia bacterium]
MFPLLSTAVDLGLAVAEKTNSEVTLAIFGLLIALIVIIVIITRHLNKTDSKHSELQEKLYDVIAANTTATQSLKTVVDSWSVSLNSSNVEMNRNMLTCVGGISEIRADIDSLKDSTDKLVDRTDRKFQKIFDILDGRK